MDEARPDYTEFGIKIHKLRLTLKVQRRASLNRGADDDSSHNNDVTLRPRPASSTAASRRPRSSCSSASSVTTAAADSLRMLDLDPQAGSRRPINGTRLANWEFQGFYAPSSVRTSTPSSGYSSAAISRASSFSSQQPLSPTKTGPGPRMSSVTTDDSLYSDVYATIEETLDDVFDDDDEDNAPPKMKKPQPPAVPPPPPVPLLSPTALHQRIRSMTSLDIVAPTPVRHTRNKSMNFLDASPSTPPPPPPKTLSLSWSSLHRHNLATSAPSLPPPPLPPRLATRKPPARPPYPSSAVRA